MKSMFLASLAIGVLIVTPVSALQENETDVLAEPETTQPRSVVQEIAGSDSTSTVQQPVQETRSDAERAEIGGIFSPSSNALFVQSVYTNGPLYQKEVQSGDMISTIDGKDVRSNQDVVAILVNKNPGDSVAVTRIRQGATEDLTVELMSREELFKAANGEGLPDNATSRQYVGTRPMYSADVLKKVDERLQLMSDEIQNLRKEIEILRKQAAEANKEKDG